MRRSVRRPVRAGDDNGRDDRSRIPATPATRYLSAHFFAVAGEQLNRSAARRNGHPVSTISLASRKRPDSDNGALRWGTRTSGIELSVVTHAHHALTQRTTGLALVA